MISHCSQHFEPKEIASAVNDFQTCYCALILREYDGSPYDVAQWSRNIVSNYLDVIFDIRTALISFEYRLATMIASLFPLLLFCSGPSMPTPANFSLAGAAVTFVHTRLGRACTAGLSHSGRRMNVGLHVELVKVLVLRVIHLPSSELIVEFLILQ